MKKTNKVVSVILIIVVIIMSILYVDGMFTKYIWDLSKLNMSTTVFLLFSFIYIFIIYLLIYAAYYLANKNSNNVKASETSSTKSETIDYNKYKALLYKNMNENNLKFLVNDIQEFYSNALYIMYLLQISKKVKAQGLFNEEINEIIFNTYTFLRVIKRYFFYDIELIKQLDDLVICMNEVLEEYDNNMLETYFSKVEKFCTNFLNNNTDIELKSNHIEQQKNATSTYWNVIFSDRINKFYLLIEKTAYVLGCKKYDEDIKEQEIMDIKFISENKKIFDKLYSVSTSKKKITKFLGTNVGFKNRMSLHNDSKIELEDLLLELLDMYIKIYHNPKTSLFKPLLFEEGFFRDLGVENSNLFTEFSKQVLKVFFDVENLSNYNHKLNIKDYTFLKLYN